MVPIRDPSQDKRPTQNENEVMEKNFPSKLKGKKSWGSNAHIRQNRRQNKGHKNRHRGHFIILKGRIRQEDMNIVNIYHPT